MSIRSSFLRNRKLMFALAVLLLAAGIVLFRAEVGRRADRQPPPKPVPVTVTPVTQEDLPDEVPAFGQVTALESVSIQARVTTRIDRVLVEDGQLVKAGQVLFQLDDQEFAVSVQKARATLEHDTAQAEYARLEENRNLALLKTKSVSQDTYDQAHATYLQALGTRDMSAAALAEAELLLGYCRVVSPLDGRLGRIEVKAGNLVTENGAELVSIHRLQPIRVSFFVPETRLAQVREALAGSEPPTVFISPRDGGQTELTGRLVFMDNQVDPATGTITLEAEYPNEKLELWPGQYVSTRLRLRVDHDALVVPEAAVHSGPEGRDLVAVVGPDNRVAIRAVHVVRRQGDRAMVTGDLKTGEKLVLDGYLRVTPDALVEIQQSSEAAAKPQAVPAAGEAAYPQAAPAAK